MNAEVANKLSEARDFYTLTKGILSVCEPFGPVHSFRMTHNRGAERVACLIELESPKQQPALARALGGRSLNGSVVSLEIPVSKDFGATRKVVSLPPSGYESRLAPAPRSNFAA